MKSFLRAEDERVGPEQSSCQKQLYIYILFTLGGRNIAFHHFLLRCVKMHKAFKSLAPVSKKKMRPDIQRALGHLVMCRWDMQGIVIVLLVLVQPNRSRSFVLAGLYSLPQLKVLPYDSPFPKTSHILTATEWSDLMGKGKVTDRQGAERGEEKGRRDIRREKTGD